MTKTRSVSHSNGFLGFKEKTAAFYLVGIVIFLVLLYLGLMFYKNMPEVSFNEIKTLSITYHQELTTLEESLKSNYQASIETKDVEAWNTFTQEWVSKISAARPTAYDLKLSKKSRDVVNIATFMSRDLFQLWTEYNTAITTGVPVEVAKEEPLLAALASGHAGLNKVLQ